MSENEEDYYFEDARFKEDLQSQSGTFIYGLNKLTNCLAENGVMNLLEKTSEEYVEFLGSYDSLSKFLSSLRNYFEVNATLQSSCLPDEVTFATRLYRATWLVLEIRSHITTNPACQIPLYDLLAKITQLKTFLVEDLPARVKHVYISPQNFVWFLERDMVRSSVFSTNYVKLPPYQPDKLPRV